MDSKHKVELETCLVGLDHAAVAGDLAMQLRQLPADFRRLAHDDVTLWDIIGWLDEVEEYGHPHTHETFDEVLDEFGHPSTDWSCCHAAGRSAGRLGRWVTD